jgi:Tol biopolymer transport system component
MFPLLTACDEEGEAPGATPAATRDATPAADSDPLSQGRPAPTPTPSGHADPQALLIDLETGRRVTISAPGERVGRIAFSPDGRWLVFYRFEPVERADFEIYRVDLKALDLAVEPWLDGLIFFNSDLAFSNQGHFVFGTRDADEALWTEVMALDGSVHRLGTPGHPTSWSPDGRWLTYEEPYREGDLIDQYLVDTETWSERKIGESGACHCDSNPRPVWAPDSSKFIYTYIVGEIPDAYSVSEVHFLDGSTSVEVEDDRGWLDSQRYVTRVYDEDSYDIVAVDLASGARTLLFEANSRERSLRMSPNNDLFFTEGTLLDSNGDFVASVPGGYRRWSPDGQHIVTFSNGTSCGRGYRVQAIDGELIGCGPYPPEGSPFEFDVENNAFAYLVPGDPEVDFMLSAYVLDFETGDRTTIVEDFVATSTCIELSPDSRYVVIGHACGV